MLTYEIEKFLAREALGYDRRGLPFYPIKGAEQGYSTAGDIVTQTLDGQPLNDIWGEFARTLTIVNEQRTAFTNLLAFRTTRSSDAVAQTVGDDEFEKASEFGEPVGIRASGQYLVMGYPFTDYDLATRFTWRFLRDAAAEQVTSVHNRALHADNALTTKAIMRRILNPTAGQNSDGRTVYGLWNGDGIAPPNYLFQSFAGTHSHYMVSGGTTVDGRDLDDLIGNVTEHGYADVPGAQLLLFVNPAQMRDVARVRTSDAVGPAYDFIPSLGAPPWIADEVILNPAAQAPATYQGMKIAGSYGPAWITESGFMPPGYLLLVATGGPGSSLNPVGFREHITPAYQGLRLLPGSRSEYPLVDSFYSRGFGVGVRHRGAAAVMQIKPSGTYTPPTL